MADDAQITASKQKAEETGRVAKLVVDGLLLVSQVFRDRRIEDLLKRNAVLEAENAWNRLGSEALQRELDLVVNFRRLVPVCGCVACYGAHRWDTRTVYPEEIPDFFHSPDPTSLLTPPCIILRCLIFHAERLGLTVKSVNLDIPDVVESIDLFQIPRDCHLVVCFEERGWRLSYGLKLGRKNFHLNPHLDTLAHLLYLFHLDEFCVVYGRDYATATPVGARLLGA